MPERRERTRVALVGAGSWGRQYARVLSQKADVELCCVVGRTLERTRVRAEQYGVPYYLDLAQMLAAKQPDFVCLSLPNRGHYEPTLAVIQAGVPLLVEKPLVFDLAEADRLLQEAEKRKLFFAIDFNHRYASPVQMAHEAVCAGRIGEIVFATWRFGGEGLSDHPHANLIETQCHGFDMLEHLCGPISSVMAQMTDMTGHGFSTVILALEFANGAVGSMVGSYDSSYAYRDTHRLEVNGTLGRIVVEDTVRRYSFQRAGSETAEVWEAGYFNDPDREFHHTIDRHIEAVLEAYREGAPPPVHARAGRRALQLAFAGIQSYETGTRVSTRESAPAPLQ